MDWRTIKIFGFGLAAFGLMALSSTPLPIGTSGHKLCFLDTNCIFGGTVTLSQQPIFNDPGGIWQSVTITTATRTIADTECGTLFKNSGAGSSVVYTFPANPMLNCFIVIQVGLKNTSINFNGHQGLLDGAGEHLMDYSPPFIPLGSSNVHIAFRFDGTNWRNDKSLTRSDVYENVFPMDSTRATNGQVVLTHDAGNSRMQLCAGKQGFGGISIRGQYRRLDNNCVWVPDSVATSSLLNYYYATEDLADAVTNVVNNGSGHPRLTITSLTPTTGYRVIVVCHSILGTVEANVKDVGDVVSANTIDLPNVTFVNAFTTSPNAICRVFYIVPLTTTYAPSSNFYGTIVETGNDSFSFVGAASFGASHAFLGVWNLFGTQETVTAGSNNQLQLSNTTIYYPCEGWSNVLSAVESNVWQPWAKSGSFESLYFNSSVAPSGGLTYTATRSINGADTAQTCTITDPATSCSDDVLNGGHVVSVAAGQTCSVKVVTAVGAASARMSHSGTFVTP